MAATHETPDVFNKDPGQVPEITQSIIIHDLGQIVVDKIIEQRIEINRECYDRDYENRQGRGDVA